ncbi:MAG: hypothetical protein R3B90_04590 [Planctomycetaceae bacterium]
MPLIAAQLAPSAAALPLDLQSSGASLPLSATVQRAASLPLNATFAALLGVLEPMSLDAAAARLESFTTGMVVADPATLVSDATNRGELEHQLDAHSDSQLESHLLVQSSVTDSLADRNPFMMRLSAGMVRWPTETSLQLVPPWQMRLAERSVAAVGPQPAEPAMPAATDSHTAPVSTSLLLPVPLLVPATQLVPATPSVPASRLAPMLPFALSPLPASAPHQSLARHESPVVPLTLVHLHSPVAIAAPLPHEAAAPGVPLPSESGTSSEHSGAGAAAVSTIATESRGLVTGQAVSAPTAEERDDVETPVLKEVEATPLAVTIPSTQQPGVGLPMIQSTPRVESRTASEQAMRVASAASEFDVTSGPSSPRSVESATINTHVAQSVVSPFKGGQGPHVVFGQDMQVSGGSLVHPGVRSESERPGVRAGIRRDADLAALSSERPTSSDPITPATVAARAKPVAAAVSFGDSVDAQSTASAFAMSLAAAHPISIAAAGLGQRVRGHR